jgi:REP element-mobilizing transposase RayT
MPNHVHGIVMIVDRDNLSGVGATHASPLRPKIHPVQPTGPRPGSLGAIIGSFKSAAARRVNAMHDTKIMPLWQRNYYEHVIRNEDDLLRIRKYIVTNPATWLSDENHPSKAVE